MLVMIAPPSLAQGHWEFDGVHHAHYGCGAVRIEDRIYIVGGDSIVCGDAPDHMDIYDVTKGAWSVGPTMPGWRQFAAVAAIDEKIYVAGGQCWPWTYFDSLFVYDESSGGWSQRAPIPETLSGAMGVAFGGKLLVFGGEALGHSSSATYVYDPRSDVWSRAADMPAPVCYGGAAIIGPYVYVVGGSRYDMLGPPENDLFRYDPVLDAWSVLASMHTARCLLGVAAHEGGLFVAGGFTESGVVSTTEIYDPLADAWSEAAQMPRNRAAFPLIELDDALMAPNWPFAGFRALRVA